MSVRGIVQGVGFRRPFVYALARRHGLSGLVRNDAEGASGTEAGTVSEVVAAIANRLNLGGKGIAFSKGGSATDANDLVADCLDPLPGLTPLPAISLLAESANITAIANDIGTEATSPASSSPTPGRRT